MRTEKKWEREKRKVHAQISIAKKTAKRNDGSSLTYIYNAMVLRRYRGTWGVDNAVLFSSFSSLLLGQWCIWHMSVSSCALLFFSSTCANEMKKKKKRIRRSKWVLVTLSGLRANDRWLMLADFRILFHYICASPLFRYIYLSSPAVSPFSFRWQVEVVAGALLSQSDPITAFIHPRTQVRLTSVTANVMVKKELHRHPYLYISSPASRSMRVYTLLVN